MVRAAIATGEALIAAATVLCFPNLPAEDLVTDRQAAEFTFIQWAPTGSNGTREPKLTVDLAKLDRDERVGDRRRVLSVYSEVRRFLNIGGGMQRLLRARSPGLADKVVERHGDKFSTIGVYWRWLSEQDRVRAGDLTEPGLRAPTS